MWDHVAAKLFRDKIICRALFTKRALPAALERYQRLYAAISEAIEAAETRYFTRLRRKCYTLSKHALDLCQENAHFDRPMRLTAEQKSNAQRRKKKILESYSIKGDPPERAGLKQVKVNQDCSTAYDVEILS